MDKQPSEAEPQSIIPFPLSGSGDKQLPAPGLNPNSVRAGGYRTSDMVTVSGGLGPDDLKELLINGLPPIYLDRRQFLAFFILACHARTFSGLSTPFKVSGGRFLPRKSVIKAIDAFLKAIGLEGEFMTAATEQTVSRILSEIRIEIAKMGGNLDLIERGPRGTGHRLSTPGNHVTVRFLNWRN